MASNNAPTAGGGDAPPPSPRRTPTDAHPLAGPALPTSATTANQWSQQQTSTQHSDVVVGGNWPVPPSTTADTSNMDLELSERSSRRDKANMISPLPPLGPVQTPLPPPPPQPSRSALPPPQPQQQWPSPPNKSMTMDDWVDRLLTENNNDKPPSALHPSPLAAGLSDLEKMRALVQRRAWADVVNVCQQTLSQPSYHASLYQSLLKGTSIPSLETHQAEVVEIMAVYVHALLQLRRYGEAQQLVESWSAMLMAKPDWVPWSLVILATRARDYEALLVDDVDKLRPRIPNDDVASHWHLLHVRYNICVQRQEWRVAVRALEDMLELLLLPCAYRNNDDDDRGRLVAARTLVLCRQGRVLLQAGALREAERMAQRAAALWHESASSLWNASSESAAASAGHNVGLGLIPAHLSVNQGLLSFAQSKYDEALQHFQHAVSIIRKLQNRHKQTPAPYDATQLVGPFPLLRDDADELYAETVNNMALCALYTCKLPDAVAALENLIRADPVRFLSSRIAFNLCTLYELGHDTPVAARKKRVLQVLAKRFYLHDIGPESFRLG